MFQDAAGTTPVTAAVAVAVMLAEAAPWLPWLTAFFAAICAWNAGQIVKLRNPT